ncbi:MAG: transglycosylase domain-containing protein [Bacteroidales bacterium]|nr:transglycosylase domain-containing protein [Bacteroidales bacterium]
MEKIKENISIFRKFLVFWWSKFIFWLKYLEEIVKRDLPFALMLINLWWRKFLIWRRYRLERYRRLIWYRKIANLFLTGVVLLFIYIFLVDINFLWLFGRSPGLYSINRPEQSVASEIITADGKLLGKYFRENRTPVSYEEISPKLINTLICTEDARFYSHFGIDFHGVLAAFKDMTKGKPRGASTITQQLVKNMFETRNHDYTGLFGYIPGLRLLIMKTKEWISAVKLEIFYSKEEILTMYLNTVNFGSNSYGIKTAAKTFFQTTPAELNYEQSATLVGLLKATTTYSPVLNPEKSKSRRNVVLENLFTHHVITRQECDSLKELPLKLDFRIEQSNDGNALYFKAYLAKFLEKWQEENDYDIYSDGLKIYVTIDSRMQIYAEQAVNKQMRRLQSRFFEHWRGRNPWQDEKHRDIPNFIEDLAKKTDAYIALKDSFDNNTDSINKYLNLPRKIKVFDYRRGEKDTTLSIMDSIRYMNRFLHGSFVALEPETGNIRAWVGDISFKFWQYDKVAQAKRQAGSTFKLFVYTAAVMNGISPCATRIDKPIAWRFMIGGKPRVWTPQNANREFLRYPVTLKNAFARSINTIAVQIAYEVGISEIIKYAHLLGIKSDLEYNPSLCLGSSDVTLLELVNSYSTVVNEGIYHDPVIVTRIEDKEGNIIYEHESEQKRVIPYQAAWLMTEMLKGGMTEPGATTKALWGWDLFRYNTNFGGKTGTSSNYSDAWFVGVTPKLVGGAWVGGEHRSIHFRSGQLGQGSRTALPIFGLFMEKVLADKTLKHYRGKFPTKPKETILLNYKCHTYVPPDTTLVDSSQLIITNPIPTDSIVPVVE